jgi:hypothetical protein
VARKPKRQAKAEEPVKSKHENPVKRFAEQVESHLMEGAELATSTTSAETNVAMAALGAIEGPGEPKPKAEKKPAKRDKARPRAR